MVDAGSECRTPLEHLGIADLIKHAPAQQRKGHYCILADRYFATSTHPLTLYRTLKIQHTIATISNSPPLPSAISQTLFSPLTLAVLLAVDGPAVEEGAVLRLLGLLSEALAVVLADLATRRVPRTALQQGARVQRRLLEVLLEGVRIRLGFRVRVRVRVAGVQGVEKVVLAGVAGVQGVGVGVVGVLRCHREGESEDGGEGGELHFGGLCVSLRLSVELLWFDEGVLGCVWYGMEIG